MPQENFARRHNIGDPSESPVGREDKPRIVAVTPTKEVAPVTSILSHNYAAPLDKFNDRGAYNGRTRLIHNLNQQIAEVDDDPNLLRDLKRQRAYLERMQFNSRVTKANQRPRRGRY